MWQDACHIWKCYIIKCNKVLEILRSVKAGDLLDINVLLVQAGHGHLKYHCLSYITHAWC